MHLTSGVDGADTFGHCSHLGLAKLALNGMQLPIHIGFGDMVEINQRDPANRIACQGLNRPRTDTADADDAHMCRLETRQTSRAIQTRNATKAALQVDFVMLYHGTDQPVLHRKERKAARMKRRRQYKQYGEAMKT